MSLPSIPVVAQEMGVDLVRADAGQNEAVLVAAMRRDLPLAVTFLCAQKPGQVWVQDPGSPAGKQLIRLHASDALRRLASRHLVGGRQLVFSNCCNGIVLEEGEVVTEDDLLELQIKTQTGPIAYADC